jgi:hypothetical protein
MGKHLKVGLVWDSRDNRPNPIKASDRNGHRDIAEIYG